ncbi:MAG: hypothetical protein AUI11_00540 [Acidobacteria bacterium 13_2_20CM_2_66_4]|nr:MAG: hypothetical protein AUI11_00540 [Acidobacteria bacterium 13_2_20CM_2_66_4]
MIRILIASVAAAAALSAAPPLPASLQAMVDAERAFSRRAAEVGMRDSFLEFFADDAVRFDAAPSPAKAFLRQLKPQPPSIVELKWEPRFGDIAASGELGYLTGPAMRVVHNDPPAAPAHICYFSIWRKQANSSYKVFIDQGIGTPNAPSFAPDFTRADATDRFAGDARNAQETLTAADRSAGPPLARDARVYRDGMMPFVGDAAARQMAQPRETTTKRESLFASAAMSGDLGVTYGKYTVTQGGPEEGGHYVRVWSRTRAGQWRVALEVNAPRQ